MDDPADYTPPMVAAPRHLRRRLFHEEIADGLLVPGAEPVALRRGATLQPKRAAETPDPREYTYRRKRLVALLVVMAVSLSVPVLIIALVLAG